MSIAVLNELFPDEASLEGVGEALQYAQVACGYFANEIKGRSGAEVGVPDFEAHITGAQQSWDSLKGATVQTRAQVQSMTSEIQALDQTKDNLVTSVTILKRLQMLTKLQHQLEDQLKEGQYREIAATLPAARELSEHFREFRTLPHVAHLSQLVADTEAKLVAQVLEQIKGGARSSADMEWACRAAESSKDELVEAYCERSLATYKEVFSLGSEAAGLDNIDRRFAMLRNVINKHDTASFPSEWHVGAALAKAACDKTRQDISLLQFGVDSNSVQLLLNSLQQSTEFESWLRRKFPEHVADFATPISRSFTPHLQIWVEFHERTLSDKLRLYSGHTWNEDVEDSDVLASSTDLFLYYRNAMDQMSKLSVGQPMVALSGVFSRYLSRYATLLQSYLPRTIGEEEIFLSQKVLRTASYCISTTQQLETSIYNLVDEQLKQEIDFSVPNDKFNGTIKACLETFTTQITDSLKLSWREMANVNWQRLQQAGDESLYVRELAQVVTRSTGAVASALPRPQHQRIVCDAVVQHLTLQFLQVTMGRIRPVSVVAAEQLLLDFYHLKSACTALLEDLKYREKTVATFAQIEAVLKVLLTQNEPAEGLVQNYLLLTKDGAVNNFRKVLEAKGLRAARYTDLFQSMSKDQGYEQDLYPLSRITMLPPRVTSPPPEPVTKFSENFKRIGDFLRRDTPNASPLMR